MVRPNFDDIPDVQQLKLHIAHADWTASRLGEGAGAEELVQRLGKRGCSRREAEFLIFQGRNMWEHARQEKAWKPTGQFWQSPQERPFQLGLEVGTILWREDNSKIRGGCPPFVAKCHATDWHAANTGDRAALDRLRDWVDTLHVSQAN